MVSNSDVWGMQCCFLKGFWACLTTSHKICRILPCHQLWSCSYSSADFINWFVYEVWLVTGTLRFDDIIEFDISTCALLAKKEYIKSSKFISFWGLKTDKTAGETKAWDSFSGYSMGRVFNGGWAFLETLENN